MTASKERMKVIGNLNGKRLLNTLLRMRSLSSKCLSVAGSILVLGQRDCKLLIVLQILEWLSKCFQSVR